MALHFTRAEYDRRIKATTEAMARDGLDGLLMFQQESIRGRRYVLQAVVQLANVAVQPATYLFICE
jgi:Xaa-Pro aminopeptidase